MSWCSFGSRGITRRSWWCGTRLLDLPVGLAPLLAPGCSPRFVEGTGEDSGSENTFENASRVKLVHTLSLFLLRIPPLI